MAFFGGFLAEGSTHPIFNALIFRHMKGVEVVHIWAKFLYVWFVVWEFSNFKCFGRSRKYYFRLTFGGFLAITPQNGVRYVWYLDHQCNTRQWVIYVTLFIVLLENGGNSARTLILWHIFRGFWFTPSYTLWVTPQFLVKWEVPLRCIIISIAFVVLK